MIDLKNITFAHRGIHNNSYIPENSLKAFKRAIDKNIPIEIDVHILKDNTLVVFHDSNLFRMTNVNGQIKDYTYKELKKLRLLNTDCYIPTLDEVLKLVNGKVLLNIEIKNDNRTSDICKILCEKLDNYNGDFLIQSFYPYIVKWLRDNKKEYMTGLLLKDDYDSKIINFLSTNKVLFNYCKPQFLSVSKKIVTTRKIQKYRKKFPILVWTIKTDNEINKYRDFTDGFISNNLK